MTRYEELTDEAYSRGLAVREKPLQGADGRIKGSRIAIRKDLKSQAEKACTLAEELGHYYTTTGNILAQETITDRKQELRAREYAYKIMVPLEGLLAAHKAGCCSRYEVAEYLDIPEEFLQAAIERYAAKYGTCVRCGAYIVFFEPALGILRELP